MAKAGKNIPESSAGSVPVKDLRPPADWHDELGLDRQRADLINGDLIAWWQHYATGEYHEIPRAYWRGERAVEFANGGWGWPLGGGLFSSEEHHRCAIYMARPGPSKGAKQGTASQPNRAGSGAKELPRVQKEIIRRMRLAYRPDGVPPPGTSVTDVRKRVSDRDKEGDFHPGWDTVKAAMRKLPKR